MFICINIFYPYFSGVIFHISFIVVQYIPGTTKMFHGLKNPQDRADVIAYLKQSTA
ncbi:putative cytochrome c-like domain superfamily [Helianthus annuus]|nr:putative cytochrome c-like domain superfamily [Helianthus annuus]KAJ0607601.1 putative cytochrome c-like domain superfamily [Helianthus annuus]KAJ0767664.1 putative cytochrome c-like domain superfamily [Helianthus annuus]